MIERTVTSRLPNGALGQRIAPKLAPGAYRSFEVHSPIRTHYRDATCAEVECQHHLAGWISQFDRTTPQGKRWSEAIRRSGRRYSVTEDGAQVTFTFPPGQQCFAAPHKVPTGRPELFVVRDGDWRGNPTGRKTVTRPAEFVERMAENLGELERAAQRG